MTDFVDHSSISSTQLTDGIKVLVFQLTDLGFLGEEGLQSFPLLLIQVQFAQLLLQGLQVGSVTRIMKNVRKRSKEDETVASAVLSSRV